VESASSAKPAEKPSYALGYAWLANTYGQLGDYVGPRKDFMLKSKETSQKALQLDDNVAVAHGALDRERIAEFRLF